MLVLSVTASRAAILRDRASHIEVVETLIDPPGPGEVRLRTMAAGVCGSDRHAVNGRSLRSVYPLILGHECAGLVESVGPGVDAFSPGDRVVVSIGSSCGRCDRCTVGEAMLCSAPSRGFRVTGLMGDGSARVHYDGVDLHPYVGCGALAELVVVPAHELVRVPEDVPFEVAALIGCGVTTGLSAVFDAAQVPVGAITLVVGCGGVGLNVVQGCRLAGASRIIAADTNPNKLKLASVLGATDVIDTSAVSLGEAVRTLVPDGVHVAFEAVGISDLVTEALSLTRRGGTCVAVGIAAPGTEYRVSADELLWQRRLTGTVAGGLAGPRSPILSAFDLYRAGRLELDSLVGARLSLDRVEEAFDAVAMLDVARAVVMFEGDQ
jgi:S-(hydroxymethyl)glutathione dehydrogenase / alcohol dehydrogenase